MILSHQSILFHQAAGKQALLEPFEAEKVVHPETGNSYGCGACGYDVRIRETILMPPGSFALASTLERFMMPNDIAAFVTDKSSMARIGISVQNTKIDPGWQGFLTLEISNHSSETIQLIGGQPIAEITFHYLDKPTDRPYRGKYQYQPARPQPAIREAQKYETASPTAVAGAVPQQISGC